MCDFLKKTNLNFNFLILFLFRHPFQQSGYIPLEAGKYYWIEALHKEGARRDSLSVGYTLECPNAPSVLSEKPILKPSLQYNIPRKWYYRMLLRQMHLKLIFSSLEENFISRDLFSCWSRAQALAVVGSLSCILVQYINYHSAYVYPGVNGYQRFCQASALVLCSRGHQQNCQGNANLTKILEGYLR